MSNAPEQDHHYFGSTAYNWATGSTPRDVLEKLGRSAGASVFKNLKKVGGLYAVVWRVNAPSSAHYAIRNYAPADVAHEEGIPYMIQNIKGHVFPYIEP